MVNLTQRKIDYTRKVHDLLREYSRVLVVLADNVGSHHMQLIRKSLRKQAILLMGKNTMMRKSIRGLLEENPKLSALLSCVKNNVGFVFTNADLSEVRKIIAENRVGAPAKAGSIAPCDVWIPKGDTGLEPTQTGFLQALNIATRINKGQIMILNDTLVIKKGDKVGASEATLLQKLKITPFTYGLEVVTFYDDGFVFEPSVLNITSDDLLAKFRASVHNIAAISLRIGLPTLASVPHSLANAYKNVLSVSLATDYTFEKSKSLKALLADPEALARAAAAASAAAPVSAAAPAAKADKEEKPAKEEKKKESESEEDMGFGLFD